MYIGHLNKVQTRTKWFITFIKHITQYHIGFSGLIPQTKHNVILVIQVQIKTHKPLSFTQLLSWKEEAQRINGLSKNEHLH